jgi:hypothetical protein
MPWRKNYACKRDQNPLFHCGARFQVSRSCVFYMHTRIGPAAFLRQINLA